MPYIFQKEIEKTYPHYTGCEKFDSLYRLYDIFKDLSYFLINLFFEAYKEISTDEISNFLKSAATEYKISHYVVRCEKKSETQPVSAIAFTNINNEHNLKKCADYIQNRIKQGYNCIIHEVIQGFYPSNRLDWLYSFGIWYQNSMPQIEIYPATDASSIKWGKLSPLDLISMDSNLNITYTKIHDKKNIKKYQEIKLNEWIEQFEKEIDNNFPQKNLFTNFNDLSEQLKSTNHILFDLNKIDSCIHQTKDKLINIALKYASFARTNNINPDKSVIHGSLLYNMRMIIWDISTNKRWQYLTKEVNNGTQNY